jgi:RNA polymerase primary sigma factor
MGGTAIDNSEILSRAVSILLADSERQGGRLDQARVVKLAEKLDLDGPGYIAVCAALQSCGVRLSEPPEVQEAQGLGPQRKLRTACAQLPGLSAVFKLRLLTPVDEADLGRRIAVGRRIAAAVAEGLTDPKCPEALQALRLAAEARDKLVLHNMRLVVSVARTYVGSSGLELADLVQEGTAGLMRAAEMYDHTLGFRFTTYSMWWIKQAIRRARDNQGRTIRLPIYRMEQIRKFRRAKARLEMTTGRSPSAGDLAAELDWPMDKVLAVEAAARLATISLDAPADPDGDPGNGRPLVGTLASPIPGPEEILIERALSERVREVLSRLPKRTRTVLEMRNGFQAPGPMTLEEIGQRFGVTRERIRQIEAKGLRKLKYPAYSRRLRDFAAS